MVSLMLRERMHCMEDEYGSDTLLIPVKEVWSSLSVHTQLTHPACREQSLS